MTRALTAAALALALIPLTAAAQGYAGVSAAPQVHNENLNNENPVAAVQKRLEERPEVVDEIRQLQSDPEFQDVLSDPEIRKALESGDTAALLTNPKINNLTTHPAVQEITKKLNQ
ncbi:MAG TPA: hypothetical protein VMW56_27850 [Candidatus Margulisiibacteriota bacterium]|nr:hypothetical protein [Candidatus Margulisiibacteriota bacterium]